MRMYTGPEKVRDASLTVYILKVENVHRRHLLIMIIN